MSPFTYSALDLLADHDPRFAAFPKIWADQINGTDNPDLERAFTIFLWASISDALVRLNQELTDKEFNDKLGTVSDREKAVAKILGDLGEATSITSMITAYFAGRRNLRDDERCWISYVRLVEQEIDIRAC